MLQQLKSYTNIAQPLLELPMQVYGRARDTTMQTYEANLVKVKQTQKDLLVFKKEFIKYAKDISRETFNQLIHILEVIARVEDRGLDVLEKKKLTERIQLIYQSALKVYFQQPYKIGKEKTIEVYHQSHKLAMKKCLPLYIHLKAALIVSQEMLQSFIQSRVSDLKMTYETSKDSVVMFFSGNFNEEVLKEKLANGVEGFKQLTIKIVSKGLEVKVDKESLVQNYDKFVVDFLRVVHQMKEKSQENIGEVKKKSKDLYQQVVNRIKAKELQIRTQMRSSEESFLDKQDE